MSDELQATLLPGFLIPGPAGPTGPAGAPGIPTTVRDEGVVLPTRQAFNFVGAGVTATDDPVNNWTTITIPGTTITGDGQQTPWLQTVDAAGYSLVNVGMITTSANAGFGGRFLQVFGTGTELDLDLRINSAPADRKQTRVNALAGSISLQAINDAYSAVLASAGLYSDPWRFEAPAFYGSGVGLTANTVPIASLVAGDYSGKITAGTYNINVTGFAASASSVPWTGVTGKPANFVFNDGGTYNINITGSATVSGAVPWGNISGVPNMITSGSNPHPPPGITGNVGTWWIASDGSGMGIGSAAMMLQQNVGGQAPRLAFNWVGAVAAQIGVEPLSGHARISILNTPGTAYESLVASNFAANGICLFDTIFTGTDESGRIWQGSVNFLTFMSPSHSAPNRRGLINMNYPPLYVNDAAAAAAGLVHGDIYRQGDTLCVRQ